LVAQGGTCGTKLLANTSCTIKVAFQPTTTGSRSGTLSIKDFNPASPQTVSLSGTGT